MPTKVNSAGKQQPYDPHTGRYVKVLPDWMNTKPDPKYERKQRNRIKREREQAALDYAALNSQDPYLYVVYWIIKKMFNNRIVHVNHNYTMQNGRSRELDIVTHHTIIEIKSGPVHHKADQLLAQMNYAKSRNKQHIVYAPDIAYGTKIAYSKMGLNIVKTIPELINILKEYEK